MIRSLSSLLWIFCVLVLNYQFELRGNSDLAKGGWKAIPEEELSIGSGKVDPEADAEFLYRKLNVDDSGSDTLFKYHNRLKIYTEAGVDKLDKIDLLYQTGWRIYSIKARIIYPDGSVAYLDKSDVYTRQIYKDDKFEGNAKSFSFPNLSPGCIIEYRWTASRRYWVPSFDIPVRAEWATWNFDLSIKFHTAMASRIVPYNCRIGVDKKGGKYYYSSKHEPAASTKSYIPPRKDFEPFIYLQYASHLNQLTQKKYWDYRGGTVISVNSDYVKAKQKEVKKLAAKLFEGLYHGEDKLKAAYEYCTQELTNISFYTDKYTEEELENLKENDNPNMTIRNCYGTRYDINGVFASLASVAGFHARFAQVENHQLYTYNKNALSSFNLSDWIVSIRQGETWRFFDPGSRFLPIETLNPENVDGSVITTEKKYYYLMKTSKVEDDYSNAERTINASVDEYGDLEGEVTILYKGYESLWRKRLFSTMTDEEVEEYIEQDVWKSRLPRSSVKEVVVEGVHLHDNELRVSYRLKVPGYADVLDNRIIVKPSLFEVASPRLFPEEERTEGIAFNFKTHQRDKVTISVPEGYSLEKDYSKNANIENALLDFTTWSKFDARNRELYFERNYTLKALRVANRFYAAVQEVFDVINHADSTPIALVNEDVSN
ncbi:DUF3857 domain-containing protein [Puniceicoccaceae bacterium K14]|nr:DUF3857 domain-containing protein [Puniceicoccaceae bacterium K14]